MTLFHFRGRARVGLLELLGELGLRALLRLLRRPRLRVADGLGLGAGLVFGRRRRFILHSVYQHQVLALSVLARLRLGLFPLYFFLLLAPLLLFSLPPIRVYPLSARLLLGRLPLAPLSLLGKKRLILIAFTEALVSCAKSYQNTSENSVFHRLKSIVKLCKNIA